MILSQTLNVATILLDNTPTAFALIGQGPDMQTSQAHEITFAPLIAGNSIGSAGIGDASFYSENIR